MRQTILYCLLLTLRAGYFSLGQTTTIDSLQHFLVRAKEDTNKVLLLDLLSSEYVTVDPQRGMDLAESTAVLSRRLNYEKGIALSERVIGRLCRQKRDFETAIVHFKEAEKLFLRSGNEFELAGTYFEYGRCLISSARRQAGLDTLNTAKTMYLTFADSPDSAIALFGKKRVLESSHYIWYAYFLSKDFQKELEILKECERTAITYHLEEQLPNFYNDFGVTYRQFGDFDKAIEYYLKGLGLAEQLSDWESQHRIRSNLAVIYELKGEFARANEHLAKALHIITSYRKQDRRSLAHVYMDLAGIETQQANYASALDHYLSSLRLFEQESTPRELADLLIEIGEFYSLQSDYANAIASFNRAREYYQLLGKDVGVSQVMFELGKVATTQRRFHDALEYHAHSLSLRRQIGDRELVAQSLIETGNLFLTMSQDSVKGKLRESSSFYADSAASFFQQAADVSRDISDESTMAKAFFGLGQVYSFRGNWSKAYESFDRSRHLADSLGLKKDVYLTYASLAEVSAKLQRYDEAYRYHTLYSVYKDSVFNETSSKQLKEIQAKYDTEKKDFEITSLHQQNEIAGLKVKQQESALKQAALQSAQKESDLKLLNQAKQLQQQQLENANRTLTQRELEAKARSAELEAAHKDQLLQEHNLQEQRLIMYGTIAFAVLTIAFGVVLFGRFRLRKELDKRNAVLEERRRISSDMHDDLGSSLSTIALLSQVMKQHSPETQDRTGIEKISVAAQQSLEKMSEIVWSLNPRNDKLENLVAYIRKYAVEYFESSPVKCSVTMSGIIPDVEITGEQRRNVFLTVKESLHNIIKHSRATCAELRFEFRDNTLQLSIHDNGKGIDTATQNMFGNGIMNMQRRMKEAGGEVVIESENGTTVRLALRLA